MGGGKRPPPSRRSRPAAYSRFSSPNTPPAPASAGTATSRCFRTSSRSPFSPPAPCASAAERAPDRSELRGLHVGTLFPVFFAQLCSVVPDGGEVLRGIVDGDLGALKTVVASLFSYARRCALQLTCSRGRPHRFHPHVSDRRLHGCRIELKSWFRNP